MTSKPHSCLGRAKRPSAAGRTYTWARRGQQPKGETSGKRKGYKVFIDYFTGHFFYQGQDGRRNSAAAIAFLTRVLEQTSQPIILIQDGAKYHTSTETQAFFAQQTARRQVVQLPTYSPDYNPSEKSWKKINRCSSSLPMHRKKFSRSAAYRPNWPKLLKCICHKDLFLECYSR